MQIKFDPKLPSSSNYVQPQTDIQLPFIKRCFVSDPMAGSSCFTYTAWKAEENAEAQKAHSAFARCVQSQ